MSDIISTRGGSRMLGTEKPMAAIGGWAEPRDPPPLTGHA
jgi:hypothetical protein